MGDVDEGYIIDQGDTAVDEEELRRRYLPPYEAALEAGVRTIMVSFSSWHGAKMHAHRYLLTDVLKGELGFDGIVVSDWAGIDQIPGDYASDIVTSINAGIDMVMVPDDFGRSSPCSGASRRASPDGADRRCRAADPAGEARGRAVRTPLPKRARSPSGLVPHRDLAREAVQRRSCSSRTRARCRIDLDANGPRRRRGRRRHRAAERRLDDQPAGRRRGHHARHDHPRGAPAGHRRPCSVLRPAARSTPRRPATADVAIVVLAEQPYAEGAGDRADLALRATSPSSTGYAHWPSGSSSCCCRGVRSSSRRSSGWDAFVAAWLPGTEGDGVADVLVGDAPFTGHLPLTWPRWMSQLPFAPGDPEGTGCEGPLFPLGFGLAAGDPSPGQLACPPA